jgi:2-polyprenyl-6-methoxyphenol hydroxylase-like FAD-dependent oxidoreductase
MYTAHGAFMKPRVVPHNRPPQARTNGDGGAKMTEHAVVIAGGGPAGMMLAAELALAKVDVAVVERRPDHVLVGSRAGGFHSRTIEVLDQRGVADRFLAEGQVAQAATFGTTVLDMSDFPTRHPYSLGIWQNQIERIMAAWIAELPVDIYYASEVTGFAQDDTGVDVRLSDGEPLRARYLVGCDGGRSLIRRAAGIEFPGWDPTRSALIAEVELTEEPPQGVRYDAIGVHGLHRMEDGTTVRIVVTEQQLGPGSEPTLRDLSEALITVFGSDFGIHDPTWISRFSDMTRQAAAYRRGRVLLAGDAAHVHSPTGGQGLSLGVQDAVNLGWKLAQVVHGTSPETLLDTYHAERHPVAARALRHTMAQTVLQRHDERIKALVDVVSDLASMDEPRRRLAGISSGLDIHYDFGEGHPLLGRRMPDLDLVTADGPLRVFELLHDARPLLLNLGQPGDLDITPWADRVRLIDASYEGEWELPVLGVVSAPTAALIRPDGYVAWVGDGTDLGLRDALATWFGPPTATTRGRSSSSPTRPRLLAPAARRAGRGAS